MNVLICKKMFDGNQCWKMLLLMKSLGGVDPHVGGNQLEEAAENTQVMPTKSSASLRPRLRQCGECEDFVVWIPGF